LKKDEDEKYRLQSTNKKAKKTRKKREGKLCSENGSLHCRQQITIRGHEKMERKEQANRIQSTEKLSSITNCYTS